jgi:acyl carrier protein
MDSLVTPLEVIRLELDDSIQPELSLEDSGMDSLEFIELNRRLEQVFEIRIDESDLEDVATFGELIALVDRKRIEASSRPVTSQFPS